MSVWTAPTPGNLARSSESASILDGHFQTLCAGNARLYQTLNFLPDHYFLAG